ncbi:hypothetical protein SK128_006275 [Halocaridina rubra]|uniref:C-type lectin domain-containing protein n=1 Tax=Halocaridina rubra TaxID=373956 RepID=A0AAN9AE43_HALRR
MLRLPFLLFLSFVAAQYNYIEIIQNLDNASGGCEHCPKDPNCIFVSNSWYCKNEIKMAWEYAKVKCPRTGGILADFPDRATLVEVMGKFGCELWIGATVPVAYKLPSIYWSWLTGYGIPEDMWVPDAPTGTSFCAFASCECVNKNITGCIGMKNADCSFKKGHICRYD